MGLFDRPWGIGVVEDARDFEGSGLPKINPANGLPMRDSLFDIMGNLYGTNETSTCQDTCHHELTSFDPW